MPKVFQLELRHHRLEFEVPGPARSGYPGRNTLALVTHETIAGVPVRYSFTEGDLEEYGVASIAEVDRKFGIHDTAQWIVKDVTPWLKRMDVRLRDFFVELIPERMLGGNFEGRAICGKRRRAILQSYRTGSHPWPEPARQRGRQ
jgi:hypothetical protein